MGTGAHHGVGRPPAGRKLPLGPIWATLAVLSWLGAAQHAAAQPDPPPPPRDIPTQRLRIDDKAFGDLVEGLLPVEGELTVYLGQTRIVALKNDLGAAANAVGAIQPVIAVGDESVAEISILTPRQIRLVGKRLGRTDASFTTADGRTIPLSVRVKADVSSLNEELNAIFPGRGLRIRQIGNTLVVDGDARSEAERDSILQVVRDGATVQPRAPGSGAQPAVPRPGPALGATAAKPAATTSTTLDPQDQILSLIRVPARLAAPMTRAQGSQQVLLKVRVAELNRTAFRQIGANALGYDSRSGSIFGSQIGGPITASATATPIGTPVPITQAAGLLGTANSSLTSAATVFGIFQNSNFEVFLNALRRNSILKILAEPNLVALNGHQASFLAGGEFPIPVPQVGATGVASTITVQFKKFGVSLDFLPIILDDEAIRLTVDPVVSSIDFSVGTTLVAGGSPVPGLNTRQAHTTVELKPGQTLAIAGLLQLSLDGTTSRVPGLGDLPVLGPFFSNTTSNRVEKELVVLVTPYLVEPMDAGQVPPGPGDEVGGPNDLEFYFLNRIEGRTGRDFRATTDGADPLRIGRALHLERKFVRGPVGFSD